MVRAVRLVLMVVTVIILIPASLLAGGWGKTFGGPGDESAVSARQTSDGGYIIAGNYGNDAWLIRLRATSLVDWQKTYSAGSANWVEETVDNGYIVAGYTLHGVGETDMWVMKLDISGHVEWEKAYGGADADLAHCIRQTTDGGYIVAGETDSFGAGDGDIWMLKLNHAGGVSWQRTYGGPLFEWATSIEQTMDGGYIVCGVTYSFGPGNGDVWVLKLYGNGTVEWGKVFGLRTGNENTESEPDIRQTPEGGYILSCRTWPIGMQSRSWVLKLDSSGVIEWQKEYGYMKPSSIRRTGEGGYVLAGREGDDYGLPVVNDAVVLKLDGAGEVEWRANCGGGELPETDNDYAHTIEQTADGGYIVAGATQSLGMGGYDLWLLKVDPDGEISNCGFVETTAGGLSEDTFEAGIDTTGTVDSTSVTWIVTSSTVEIPELIEMNGCNPFAGNLLDLSETGQSTSYSTGDDGDLRHGVTWPSPRFADNGNGTVTDALTGLVWLKDANCANTIGHDPDGTGDGSMIWVNALDFVAGINDETYDISDCASYSAEHTDWRLANVQELESLIHAGQANPADWLNGQGFVNVQSGISDYDRYWSSTTVASSIASAWSLYMGDGLVAPMPKLSMRYHAWPVRAGQEDFPDPAYPANVWKSGQIASYHVGDDGALQRGVAWPAQRFVDHGDGTVTDALTGLMWLKDADCFGQAPWQDALDIVSDFNTNPTGYDCADYDESDPPYDDWSLPNRKELFSLIDYSEWEPTLPADHPFRNVPSMWFGWTSTTYAPYNVNAWDLWFRDGEISQFAKNSGYNHIWPVRMANPLPDIRANGSDGPISIARGQVLSVTVSLDAVGRIGEGADWWVLARTPFGWYHYTIGGVWTPGPGVTFGGPLFDLPLYEVLNTSRLPVGSYTLYFGVDMERDGSLDLDQLFYDSAEVTITP